LYLIRFALKYKQSRRLPTIKNYFNFCYSVGGSVILGWFLLASFCCFFLLRYFMPDGKNNSGEKRAQNYGAKTFKGIISGTRFVRTKLSPNPKQNRECHRNLSNSAFLACSRWSHIAFFSP
jgi:hypothetical protein